jgi:hypothetical protein
MRAAPAARALRSAGPSHLSRALRAAARRSGPRGGRAMAAQAGSGGAAAPRAAAQEVPSGMEGEARLLEQLTAIPQVSKATVRPARAGGGVQITVGRGGGDRVRAQGAWRWAATAAAAGKPMAAALPTRRRAKIFPPHPFPAPAAVSRSSLRSTTCRPMASASCCTPCTCPTPPRLAPRSCRGCRSSSRPWSCSRSRPRVGWGREGLAGVGVGCEKQGRAARWRVLLQFGRRAALRAPVAARHLRRR